MGRNMLKLDDQQSDVQISSFSDCTSRDQIICQQYLPTNSQS